MWPIFLYFLVPLRPILVSSDIVVIKNKGKNQILRESKTYFLLKEYGHIK